MKSVDVANAGSIVTSNVHEETVMNEQPVRNNEPGNRYELAVGDLVAVAEYRREADTLVFTHTAVPSELEGHGVGSALIAGALADVRRRGLSIVPACPFVAAYVEKHADTRDLVAA